MPCKAIQNVSVRNGCILRWAWLPPALVIEAAFIADRFAPAPLYTLVGEVFPQGVEPEGTFVLTPTEDACTV